MANTSEKVMIVEDDILLLLVEERLVKRLGYEVIGTACEGKAAVRKIRMIKPDILLIDINLKGSQKGTDVVEEIRKEGLDIPVIFLSGEDDPKIIKKARQLGCIDFLLKPATVQVLDDTLRKASDYNKKAPKNAA